jgi:GntR family transcriptional regulator/MocR family aminotransferase
LRHPLAGIIDLDASLPEPLHLQLARQIKGAVLGGRLAAKARLPSSRALAAGLGISRNTAVSAIEQLKAEGYLEARQGSGLYVCEIVLPDFARPLNASAPPACFQHRIAQRWRQALAQHHAPFPAVPKPFRPGIPDLRSFPHELWASTVRRASRLLDEKAAGYGGISGISRFRTVLSAHLAETRGVNAHPDQIIITSSARAAMSLIASAILEPRDLVWIEEPGFRASKVIFTAFGARLVPVPVDERGIAIHRVKETQSPRLIYTTPSHQYPTGVMMHLSRRLELLSFAVRTNAYVIEDDYDSEFQYRGRPIASLQGLDGAGCVIYIGTFSKSLFPALRLGFLIAPKELVPALEQIHRNMAQLVPPLIQLAAADFIENGYYRAHVRRMRTLYAKRLDAFAEGVHLFSGGRLRALVPDGGMQTVVVSGDAMPDGGLAKQLARLGIDGQPLSELHLDPGNATHRGMLMGFSAWSEEIAQAFLGKLSSIRTTAGNPS